MRRLLMLGAAAVLGWAGVGSAQIVYLPLQFQFQGPQTFYYGGQDPDVFRRGFYPGTTEHGIVYSDEVYLQDARLFGYGVSDAQNEAYANVPRYFNKRDALRQALPQADGSWAVPVNAGDVPRYLDVPRAGREQASAATKKSGVIMIIPKKKPAGAAVKPAMFVSAR